MKDTKIEIKIQDMCSYRKVGGLTYLCYDDEKCTEFEAKEVIQKVLMESVGNLHKPEIEVYKTKDL